MYASVCVSALPNRHIQMLFCFILVGVASVLVGVNGLCTLSCAKGQTCYALGSDAMDCLLSIPFNEVTYFSLVTLNIYVFFCYL